MTIMRAMRRLRITHSINFRGDKKVQASFKAKLLTLAAEERLPIDPTMEAVTTALWLWVARMDPAQAEGFLAERLAELDAEMQGRAAPEEAPPPDPADGPLPPVRRRRGAS